MAQQFEAFYVAEKDRCLRTLAVSTGDSVLAEDLVAEALARAWSKWPYVRRQPNPAAGANERASPSDLRRGSSSGVQAGPSPAASIGWFGKR